MAGLPAVFFIRHFSGEMADWPELFGEEVSVTRIMI